MEWIKITKETEVPEDAVFLVLYPTKDIAIADTMLGYFSVQGWNNYQEPVFTDFTHYMVIEEPEA